MCKKPNYKDWAKKRKKKGEKVERKTGRDNFQYMYPKPKKKRDILSLVVVAGHFFLFLLTLAPKSP